MADVYEPNILLNNEFTYQQYAAPVSFPTTINNVTGDTTIINTINGGGGGKASGPSVTFTSSWGGVNFVASGNTITLAITNPTTARAALGAAKSGVNTDITQLNGASQVDVSGEYKVSGTQVVGAQQPAIPDAVLGTEVATINLILAALRVHGLIDT